MRSFCKLLPDHRSVPVTAGEQDRYRSLKMRRLGTQSTVGPFLNQLMWLELCFFPLLFKLLLALLVGVTYPAWGQPLLLAIRFISKHP